MSAQSVITRFAPSPTGALHVGSARTALYCWLYAKRHQGRFILRVEDTDHERSTPEAVQVIIDGMRWLGLHWDEEHYQTDRYPRYQAVTEQLLEQGLAYRCYCSRERLDKLRETQMEQKLKPRYDGHCREMAHADATKPHVLRFKTPQTGHVEFDDAVRGRVVIQNSELDDLILVRTDGHPTYNFAVVIDDADMKVSTVIRGEDHINNTPRQIHLYHAIQAAVPQFAHVPMILGDDGKKLSKRHGSVSVLEYRNEGFLPQALLNYLVRLGWSHGDQEIFSKEEMIEFFRLHDINKAASAFNTEKLVWLNQHYMKTLPFAEIETELRYQFERENIDLSQGPELPHLFELQKDRSKTLADLANQSRYFYEDLAGYHPEAFQQHLCDAKGQGQAVLCHLEKALSALSVEQWGKDQIKTTIKDTMKQLNLKMPQVAQPLRVAMTGGTMSPSIDATLALLGREKVLQRLQTALAQIHAK